MTRRTFLAGVPAFAMPITALAHPDAGGDSPPQLCHNVTHWRIQACFAYDALCMLGTLVDDPFYLTYYRKEYDALAPQFTAEVNGALRHLKESLKERRKKLIGPFLCWLYSVLNPHSLADLTAISARSDHLEAALRAGGHLETDAWTAYLEVAPDLQVIFRWMKQIGYDHTWEQSFLPDIRRKIKTVRADLERCNVVSADEAVLGFALPSDTITVSLLYFNQPHGMRLIGQSFCTGVVYPPSIVLRNAVHELMHPPFRPHPDPDPQKLAAMWETVHQLQQDAFLMERVNHHNPSFGYNTFEGFIEEDCVQALEQLASERLGIAKDPHKRWKESDDGMHVFAVALYSAMLEEGYNARNEVFSEFLIRMILSGKLAPGSLQPRYERFYSGAGA